MEITWLGHSCFKLKGKQSSVITDPYDNSCGYSLGKATASIVTISHDHPHHNFASGIGGNPRVLCSPGEYEIGGVFIYGTTTYHDRSKGQERGKNIIYLIEIDDIKVCHLGDLGHALSASQVEEISDADVLLVPVGGLTAIDASGAVEVINLLQPKIVIPMHYKTPMVQEALEPLEKFVKEMGMKEVTPLPKLILNKSTLPAETQVLILDYDR
ncbi:MAG: MBL fold metallo-hydrolase [Dehalococcoidia bacterium]|nr:MBL fold metallo-hydrolase [Dehalococcoidia bacterium]